MPRFWNKDLITEVKTKAAPTRAPSVKSQQSMYSDFQLNASDEISSLFTQFWNSGASSSPQQRKKRYAEYNTLDNSIAEISISLDAYADEILSVSIFKEAFSYELKGASKEEKARFDNAIKNSKLLERLRGHVRNFLKYGDLGFVIIKPKGSAENKWNNTILRPILPQHWEVRKVKKGNKIFFGYVLAKDIVSKSNVMGLSKAKDTLNLEPYQMTSIKLYNEEFEPYGKSAIEHMRSASNHLAVMMSLVAGSRANRIERIIIRVPTNTSDPTAAALKLSQVRNQFKNVVFGAGGRKRTGDSHSTTEIMFMPGDEGYTIDRLPAGSEYTNIDDLEMFRSNVQNLTRLPRFVFVNDEAADRGLAIQAQDLRFARIVTPLQDIFVRGMTRVFMMLASNLDIDLDKVNITCKLMRPARTTTESVQSMMASFQGATDLLGNLGVDITSKLKEFIDIGKIYGVPPDVANSIYDILRKSQADNTSSGNEEGNQEESLVECIINPDKKPAYNAIQEVINKLAEEPAYKKLAYEDKGDVIVSSNDLKVDTDLITEATQYTNKESNIVLGRVD